MADSSSSVSGLISGIDYRALIDQIISAEGRPAVQARNQVDTIKKQQTAISTYRGLLDTLRTAARGMRDGTAFDAMSASVAPLTGTKPLLSATGSSTAVPGSYQVTVSSTAKAQKLGATAQASTNAPAGVSGSFTINGQSVTVAATDTLLDIRDKINLLNQGTGATKVSASILSVSATAHRLVLTSETQGAAGIALADTAGTALQGLGILSTPTTVAPAAILQAGANAEFTIDGVSFSRTTNSITDAIAGVTLTLTSEDPASVSLVTIERFAEGARTAVKGFVEAYNKLVEFIKSQGASDPDATTKPVLYNDTLLRTVRASLPRMLLTPVGGTAVDLASPSAAGLSLDKNGVLSLDETKFNAAFTNRLPDLRKLLQQSGTAVGTGLSYVASTTTTKSGTRAVDITQLATRSATTGAGLAGGVFTDDGTPDTMTVTDTRLGKTVSISLTNGMTSGDIATALTSAFSTGGLGLTATDVGGQVRLEQGGFGSSAGITVAYTAGGAAGAEPVAAGTYSNGLDVAGTIGGLAATGSGQVLVGAVDTDVAGLSVRYDGATLGSVGDVTVSLGTGAEFERLADAMVQANTGSVAKRETSMTQTVLRLQERADRLETRLEVRRESLLKQFARMEVSIASFQSQGKSITAIFSALTSGAN
jgi:flagellar hook-associated protein 2